MIVAFLRRSGFPGCAQGDRVHVASSFMEMSDGSEGFGLSFMSKALRRCEREKLSDGMREGGALMVNFSCVLQIVML